MTPQSSGALDFQAIFNAAPGNYLVLSPALTIIGVTNAYLAATMTVREQILGRHLFEVFPDNPDDPAADGVRNLRASLERVLANRKSDRMQVQKYDIRRPAEAGGGFEERFWSPVNCPVLDDHGAVRFIIHTVEDVTEFIRLKRQMEDERAVLQEELTARAQKIDAEVFLRVEALEANRRLTESGRHYRFLADLVPQLIWTADADGAAVYFNQRWVEFTHQTPEELCADGWRQRIHPEDRTRTEELWTQAVRNRAGQYEVEHRLRRHDGVYRWMLTTALPYQDDDGRVLKWFGSTTDIHERVIAEEKLRQAQRLQAAGQLAGGVAHEVNNMMTIVAGCGNFALEALGPRHPAYPDVQEMLKAASRASEVTQQLLAYSRQQVFRLAVVDVNQIVKELTPALARLVSSDRHLAVQLASGDIRVRADRGQIEQVLINLVANAKHATETGGLITVQTRLAHLDRETLDARHEAEVAAGEFVALLVRDNGAGMQPEVLTRIFEPFFTTKAIGEGTGLGLSMVYGIVKQSGGLLQVSSVPGEGTEIGVYLPSIREELTPHRAGALSGRGRGERILVVEDDPHVRAIARRALESAGYQVYEAITGLAAVNFLASDERKVDVVVTDLVMPGANGRELADHLRVTHPDVPVLFMSGYSSAEMQQRGLVREQAHFIQKPFTPDALAAAVADLLTRSPIQRLAVD